MLFPVAAQEVFRRSPVGVIHTTVSAIVVHNAHLRTHRANKRIESVDSRAKIHNPLAGSNESEVFEHLA